MSLGEKDPTSVKNFSILEQGIISSRGLKDVQLSKIETNSLSVVNQDFSRDLSRLMILYKLFLVFSLFNDSVMI